MAWPCSDSIPDDTRVSARRVPQGLRRESGGKAAGWSGWRAHALSCPRRTDTVWTAAPCRHATGRPSRARARGGVDATARRPWERWSTAACPCCLAAGRRSEMRVRCRRRCPGGSSRSSSVCAAAARRVSARCLLASLLCLLLPVCAVAHTAALRCTSTQPAVPLAVMRTSSWSGGGASPGLETRCSVSH